MKKYVCDAIYYIGELLMLLHCKDLQQMFD